MVQLQSFTELVAWQQTRKLRNEVGTLVKKFPKQETYRLKDQLLRAARSITANIAEGYGRFHYKENAQYCRQARGSLYEVLDHLICAYDEQYIDKQELQICRVQIESCIKLLNGYINHLNKQKQVSKTIPNNY